ncbi:acetolactate synthase large subunit [bacterium]|nr:acetolactate synthase large subunit [bacterium]MBU1651001.1 acetolactate synthase large subunit [bacterium]
MKASDLFLKALESEGVEFIFGVPGEENADIMISLLDSPIQFIMTRHEQGAAFMADLYGRLTGKPGVCLATLGPGATNLVTGVANAHFDRSPCLAITGQASTERLHKESHQNMNVIDMFKPLTKWTTTIRQPDSIPEVIHKAFRLATTEKPGACHIELPENIAKMECHLKPIPLDGYKLRRPAPDYKAVDRAIEILRNAQRPIILAGNGCIRKRASRQLKRFVEQTGIMVAHTFMGKGAVDDRDPHSLLTAGLSARDHVSEAFEQADVVITIGYDLIEWPPDRWNPDEDKAIIHIDFEPAEVDSHYHCQVEVVSDIASALWEINEHIGDSLKFDDPLLRHIRDHILYEIGFDQFASEKHDDFDADAAAPAHSDAFPMKPQRILRELRLLMDEDDILISDVGAHKIWTARHYLTYQPNTCIISNGFCSMAIALPGAITAKMLNPHKRVVGLMGDGGFMMNVQELATAVERQIPAVYLVWEDEAFSLIKWKQENAFGKSSHTTFKNPDIVGLSRAFGAHAIRVNAAAEFGPAMQEAFSIEKKPTVVVVKVDDTENKKLTDRLGRLIAH